jgi:hypothetical protein
MRADVILRVIEQNNEKLKQYLTAENAKIAKK